MKPMWEFKVQINVPLFYWRKQRFQVEEAGLQMTESQRSYQAAQQELSYRLRERYLAAQTSHKLMELYSKQVVPQSELALESSLASYKAGGVDFLTVLSNLASIRDYQVNYYEQQSEYLKALAALEELGASTDGTGN
jgi:outer membrane protein, heavy metal efflux system